MGPACLPLLSVVVMSPAAAAAVKHFLVPHAGPVYWFAPRFSAIGRPTNYGWWASLFLLDVWGLPQMDLFVEDFSTSPPPLWSNRSCSYNEEQTLSGSHDGYIWRCAWEPFANEFLQEVSVRFNPTTVKSCEQASTTSEHRNIFVIFSDPLLAIPSSSATVYIQSCSGWHSEKFVQDFGKNRLPECLSMSSLMTLLHYPSHGQSLRDPFTLHGEASVYS